MATEYWKIKRNYATTEATLSLIARQYGHAEDTGRLVIMRADGATKDYYWNSVSLAKQTSTFGSQLIGTGAITGVTPSGGSLNGTGTVHAMMQGVYDGCTVLTPATSVRNIIQPSANVIPLLIKGFAGQTANLQVWEDSAGTDLVVITSAGAMTIASTLVVAGAITLTPLVGTGTRLVTSTAAGVLGNSTSISGANEFNDLQAFAKAITFSGNGVTGTASILRTAADGLIMRGVSGSTNDLALHSAAGTIIMRNPTGGTIVAFPGAVTMASTLTVTSTSQFTGNVGIGITTVGNQALRVYTTSFTGLSQYGVVSDPTMAFNAANLDNGEGIYAAFSTPAQAFTLTNGIGAHIASPTKGAGSTITNLYGLKVENQTAGTNNWAIHTGTGQVRLGDTLTVVSTGLFNTTVTTGQASLGVGGNIGFGDGSGTAWASLAPQASSGITLQKLPFKYWTGTAWESRFLYGAF